MDAPVDPLVAELARKTSLCWVRPTDAVDDLAPQPVWHVWHDDAVHLVSGGQEQPMPRLSGRVEVTMRSKDTGARLVTWVGEARALDPLGPEWEAAVAALATARLSIPSLTETPREWARTSTVTRVDPTGERLEGPGSLPDTDHAAPPRPTSATTAGPLPRVLHRRQVRRPPLS